MNAKRREELIRLLRRRFEENRDRHCGVEWPTVESRIIARQGALKALESMESTGGEPDVVSVDRETGEITFMDCSPESPAGRRSVCYDRAGLESRTEHKPANSAVEMAAAMGIELLTEVEYRALQELGEFDTKTSSWIRTPPAIRKLGGALFGDRRYGAVFIYHNGAQSYFGARGFRGMLRV